MSLEELMNVKVTSVSRKEQRLSKAGAAIYLITQDDIRRSGMTLIPDLLRLAPGVNVARVTSNTWAISIRGFNARYSTNVLVLIDGRTVFTPEFTGVFWDQHSVPVEEIDRIEVIRGPGGTVWGANAMNGVINIITKRPADTLGAVASAGTGSRDSGRGYARFGANLGQRVSFRLYGNYFNMENSLRADGTKAADGWHGSQAGIRTEVALSSRDTLTLQGDLSRTEEGQTVSTVLPSQGYQAVVFDDRIIGETRNILGRWSHKFGNGSETLLQMFRASAYRYDQAIDDQTTNDIDFQYHFHAGERHDLVTGFNYRHVGLDYQGFYNYRYTAPHLTSELYSAFLQDEVRLSNHVAVTVGSKIEHNSFTAFEFEPSSQVVWERKPDETLWFSVARAIRQPSWFYANSVMDAASFPVEGVGTGVLRFLGNPQSQAESLIDFSGGYRKQVSRTLSVDASVFRSYYRRTATLQMLPPFFEVSPAPPHLVIPGTWMNLAHARNYGGEMFATWQVIPRWRLSPGYSYLQMKIRRDPGSNDTSVENASGNSPKHQFRLRSQLDLPWRFEWDATGFFVSALRTDLGTGIITPIASYWRVDTRLGWRATRHLELSVTGQNLLTPRRFEFPNAQQVVATVVQRAVLGKATWRF